MNFKRRVELSEDFIPLASTADIMFLLLIFFLVTTTFDVNQGLKMDLPETKIQEDIPSENVTVAVDKEGKVYIDGKEIRVDQVAREARVRLAGHPERYVVIKGDTKVNYGRVVDILDELFGAGIHNVALPTAREEDLAAGVR